MGNCCGCCENEQEFNVEFSAPTNFRKVGGWAEEQEQMKGGNGTTNDGRPTPIPSSNKTPAKSSWHLNVNKFSLETIPTTGKQIIKKIRTLSRFYF